MKTNCLYCAEEIFHNGFNFQHIERMSVFCRGKDGKKHMATPAPQRTEDMDAMEILHIEIRSFLFGSTSNITYPMADQVGEVLAPWVLQKIANGLTK